jgi:hypothetical protein
MGDDDPVVVRKVVNGSELRPDAMVGSSGGRIEMAEAFGHHRAHRFVAHAVLMAGPSFARFDMRVDGGAAYTKVCQRAIGTYFRSTGDTRNRFEIEFIEWDRIDELRQTVKSGGKLNARDQEMLEVTLRVYTDEVHGFYFGQQAGEETVANVVRDVLQLSTPHLTVKPAGIQ